MDHDTDCASTENRDHGHLDAPRVVITTDPELDDLNSMLRLLLYSNELNLVGLVYSSSQYHFAGNASGVAPYRWPSPSSPLHIDVAVDAYERVYANLVAHDARYPSPQRLRAMIKTGNVENVGDMESDTAGSQLIRDILLDDEPGKVFLQAWGGPNTIARALKSIDDEYRDTPAWSALYLKIVNKVVLTSWGQQDRTFHEYIKPMWPDLENREVSTTVWGYRARESVAESHAVYLSADWTREHVTAVGAMGAEYRVWGDGKRMAADFDREDHFGLVGLTAEERRSLGYLVQGPIEPEGAWISEGDSSNFLLLVDNGLRGWEHPTWGSWGGRQRLAGPADPVSWTNEGVLDIGPDGHPRPDWAAARWFAHAQHDFAARLQWTITPEFGEANHAPVVTVSSDDLHRTMSRGETVRLSARAADPDGDPIVASWWHYREAGTYPGVIHIKSPAAINGEHASFVVPADALPGQTIHIVLQVSDDVEMPLTRYQRIVVTVR